MAAHMLSVVVPAYNDARHLPATIESLVQALDRSSFDAELVFVDDGSTDGSADAVRDTLAGRLPLMVVAQPNRGRFVARRVGLETASREWALLLDSRCRLDSEALAFLETRIGADAPVWNGHVYVDTRGNPYGAFWNALAEIAWREYFDDPRTTSFGTEDFDHYPKGTGCFLAPRTWLLEAMASFRTSYSNPRFASDDTSVIRWLAERHRIHVSPSFSCLYAPRTTFRAFLRQGVYRGSTFVDGHARPESRFFPVAVAFFPLSAVLALLAIRRPALLPPLALGTSVVAAGVAAAARRSRFEIVSFGLLVPPYAVAHGIGMWRGLGMAIATRVAARGTEPSEGSDGD